MKKIAVLSIGESTGKSLSEDFHRLFGAYTNVSYYSENDLLDFNPETVLGVATGEMVIRNRVLEKINDGMEYIVAQRAINHRFINELISLQPGSDVLLVNDHKDTTQSAIRQLISLGIDHVNYHPYYPGIPRYQRTDIAVTPGESRLVPKEIERIIDIGTRQIDITTLIEITRRLNLLDKIGETISSQFVSEIVGLLKRINTSAREAIFMRDCLRTVSDYSKGGIVLTDSSNNIVTANRPFLKLVSTSRDIGELTSLSQVLPDLVVDPFEDHEQLKLINGIEVLINRKKIDHPDGTPGYVYVFEDRKEIENLEIEIRRQTRKTEHVARYTYSDIYTVSPKTQEMLELSKRLAVSDSTIMILGESGTGKELLAQAIHNESKRASEPFVPVNFAALPMSLLESELFGYEDGAFTGAKKGGSKGLFEEAHGGTLFLDEIGDASMEFQIRLLRVLQEKQVRRVGGRKQIPIDVRIIAATNKNLFAEVRSGNFREDLYYRLNVLPLRTQPLRERCEDLPHLINHFALKLSGGKITDIRQVVNQEAFKSLLKYKWPGNVRELINVIDYLVQIRMHGGLLEKSSLPFDPANDMVNRADVKGLISEKHFGVLRILRDYGPVGRYRLQSLAEESCLRLSSGEIRGILVDLNRMGLAESGNGRQGSWISDKGVRILE